IQRMTPDLAKSFGLAEAHGALVAEVANGSPAAKAGVKSGDVIVEYNGRKVGRSEDLPRAVAETPIGRDVPLTVIRDGKRVSLQAHVARLQEQESPTARASTDDTRGALGLAVQDVTPDVARELGLDQ